MTFPLVIWLLVLVVAVVAAATLQLILESKGRPLGTWGSWLLWSAVTVPAVGWGAAVAHAPFAPGLLLALTLGPLIPPAVRGWLWVEQMPYRHLRERDPLEAALERYQAAMPAAPVPTPPTEPGRTATSSAPISPAHAPRAAPTDTPLTPAMEASKLSEATAAPESRLSKVGTAALLLAIVGLVPLFMIGSAVADGVRGAQGVPGRRAIVAAELEIRGYEGARLERDWVQLYCTGGDGEGYLWTAGPADGRACVWPGGVQIKVDRSRMAKDPFARPAR